MSVEPERNENKGKCKYCENELYDRSNIRCVICDRAFTEGMKLGEKIIKSEIREAYKSIVNLIKDSANE